MHRWSPIECLWANHKGCFGLTEIFRGFRVGGSFENDVNEKCRNILLVIKHLFSPKVLSLGNIFKIRLRLIPQHCHWNLIITLLFLFFRPAQVTFNSIIKFSQHRSALKLLIQFVIFMGKNLHSNWPCPLTKSYRTARFKNYDVDRCHTLVTHHITHRDKSRKVDASGKNLKNIN